jgi:acetyl esterase/lipase
MHALSIDPSRLMIAGVGAGAGLAAGVALLARDCGGPELRAQLLISPMIDDTNVSTSGEHAVPARPWSREVSELGWKALLGDRLPKR